MEKRRLPDNSDDNGEPSKKRQRVENDNNEPEEEQFEIPVQPPYSNLPNIYIQPIDQGAPMYMHAPAYPPAPVYQHAPMHHSLPLHHFHHCQGMDHEPREAEDLEVEAYHQQYLLQQEAYMQEVLAQPSEQRSSRAMENLRQGSALCRSASGTRILLQLLMEEVDTKRANGAPEPQEPVATPGNVNPQFKTFNCGRFGGDNPDRNDDMYLD